MNEFYPTRREIREAKEKFDRGEEIPDHFLPFVSNEKPGKEKSPDTESFYANATNVNVPPPDTGDNYFSHEDEETVAWGKKLEELRKDENVDIESNSGDSIISKKLVFVSAGVFTILALVVGVGAYFFRTTTVPHAPSHISADMSDEQICKDFAKRSLSCDVQYSPNSKKRGDLISQSYGEGKRVQKGKTIGIVYSAGPASGIFPNLKNAMLEDAKKTLYDLGVTVEKIDVVDTTEVEAGRVVSASIEPDTPVKNGDKVSLKVASDSFKVPDWNGKTRDEVNAEASRLGVDVEFKEEESTKPANTVISQAPSKGEFVKEKKILVTIAKPVKVKDVEIPDVVGKSRKDAQSELAGAGFTRINIAVVKDKNVDRETVSQVVPGVGEKTKTSDNIVLIVLVPDKEDRQDSGN